MTSPTYLDVGIYSIPEAARLIGARPDGLRRWLRGYRYRHEGEEREAAPVIYGQLPEVDGTVSLSFLDLMEARFIAAFRRHHIGMQSIRLAARRASELLHTDHPFSSCAFRTDGRTIFLEVANETGDPKLLDLLRRQYAFRDVLAPYLYEGIDFDGPSPVRWRPQTGVVLDPARQFGQPIVEQEGVPTAVLAGAYRAEKSFERVARWYQVKPGSVRAAVNFEEQLKSVA